MNNLQPKKRLVSFDLDMTLLNHRNWEVPRTAMEAIERLRPHSLVVVASGRNMDAPYSVAYRELLKPDAIIHTNGTRVVAEGRTIYEHLMDKGRLRELLAFADGNGLAVGLSDDEGDFYTAPRIVEETDRGRWGRTQRQFKDPWRLLEMPVKTLTYVGRPEGAELLEKRFPDFKFPLFAGRMGADIIEKEASKAEGLKRLCAFYGMDLSQTVAFGDSMNDIEIIQEAGIGVAMGNAVEELKAAADYVTDDIGQDGVWNACVKLGLFE